MTLFETQELEDAKYHFLRKKYIQSLSSVSVSVLDFSP